MRRQLRVVTVRPPEAQAAQAAQGKARRSAHYAFLEKGGIKSGKVLCSESEFIKAS